MGGDGRRLSCGPLAHSDLTTSLAGLVPADVSPENADSPSAPGVLIESLAADTEFAGQWSALLACLDALSEGLDLLGSQRGIVVLNRTLRSGVHGRRWANAIFRFRLKAGCDSLSDLANAAAAFSGDSSIGSAICFGFSRFAFSSQKAASK